jgi:hypothetical protein
MERFSIESPEYQVLFKELYKIYRKIPYDFRDNQGIIGCKWSALFYYLIYLVLSHDIPPDERIPLLHEFMAHIFGNYAFLHRKHPVLKDIQYAYGHNYMPSNGYDYTVVTEEVLDQMIESTGRGPNIIEMGISRVAQDGTAYIVHFFVLVIYKVGPVSRMFIISSWGGNFVHIRQYGKEITRDQWSDLLDDITTPTTDRPTTSTQVFTPEEIAHIQSQPMYQFFLDPAYGKPTQIVDKRDLSRRVRKQGRYFSVNSSMASLLEYSEYKNKESTLFAFNHVTPVLHDLFTLFLSEHHPEYRELSRMDFIATRQRTREFAPRMRTSTKKRRWSRMISRLS